MTGEGMTGEGMTGEGVTVGGMTRGEWPGAGMTRQGMPMGAAARTPFASVPHRVPLPSWPDLIRPSMRRLRPRGGRQEGAAAPVDAGGHARAPDLPFAAPRRFAP